MSGTVNVGEPGRFLPFCTKWGTSRGGAIDRYYIDIFVEAALRDTSGRYLECGTARYREVLRNDQIDSYDVIDIRESTPGLTIQADLHDLAHIDAESFDVIICTQVLPYVISPKRCLEELHRVLKIGGLLLLSVPFIDKDDSVMDDRWRFTQRTVTELLQPFRDCVVEGRGNLFSSVAYLQGLGMADMDLADLNRTDPTFYQLVVASAKK
ncbi:MAG TPA: class I SAM-dependent methyltransferase [Allosphingosinicella sp.]|nr:class I SAM-dependent methyltransferase [Allosphingosinicella sp.]